MYHDKLKRHPWKTAWRGLKYFRFTQTVEKWKTNHLEFKETTPEPLRLVMHGASEAPGLAVVHLWHHLGVPGLIGVDGKLDRYWLRASRRGVSIEVFDGILCFWALIKADEGHTSRQTWRRIADIAWRWWSPWQPVYNDTFYNDKEKRKRLGALLCLLSHF